MNVARNTAGGVATQSSTGGGFGAGKAIDGNKDVNWSKGSSSTYWGDSNPWWQVQFSQNFEIHMIKIYFKANTGNRLLGSRLTILRENQVVYESNISATETPPNPIMVNIQQVIGNQFKIQGALGGGRGKELMFTEVEVYGAQPPPDSPSAFPSKLSSVTPSVLLSLSPTQTAKPSLLPSSLPSSSPSSSPSGSSIPSLSPSVNVPIVRGIHMTGHADKCIQYFDNGEILLVSCNGNVQQDFKIHEDGRITALGGTYMNQCLSRSTNVNGYVALAPCENTPYMLWDHDDNRYVLRIDSLCLDIDDNFRLIVSPCRNDGTDQFWFDDTEMFPSNVPTTVPSSIPTILPSSQPTVSISPTLSESVSVEFTMELSGVSTLTADLELDIKILIIQSMKPFVITQNDIILTLVSSTSRRMLQNSNSSSCEVKVEITNSKVSSAKTRNNAENGLKLGLYKKHGIAVEVLIEDTNRPSDVPSLQPSALPSDVHSGMPSSSPSLRPSARPSSKPTMVPSDSPSMNPSNLPSSKPSTTPSDSPSILPSSSPSRLPSFTPSLMPSYKPSRLPSSEPTKEPSSVPSVSPSNLPTSNPSSEPSVYPSSLPSLAFSISPSVLHSDGPSLSPTDAPSLFPSAEPSLLPSSQPSDQPSLIPSSMPSDIPSGE